MTSTLLILLPPSETKRDGGSSALEPFRGVPGLEPIHREVQGDLIALAGGDAAAAAHALKISPRLAERELARNRELESAPLMPAASRYTGVLYDALDAETLDVAARTWLDGHVVIHSALYGLVPAAAPIAPYRLSYDSRLPGASLKARWRAPITAILDAHPGPVLDLRSQGYVGLGPLPDRAERAWAELAERAPDGSLRSLNHANKLAKGRLVRALAQRLADRPEPQSLAAVLAAVDDAFSSAVIGGHRVRIIPEGEPAARSFDLHLPRR